MEPIPLLDLKAQYAPLREDIERALARVVESQQFVLGQEVEALECEVVEYTGASYAIGCASGTDALILALAALGVGDGHEVLTTPFSFFSTASCAYKVGARPRFVDIEPHTLNIDPDRVDVAITPRTRALLPVHLFGQCADLDPLLELAARRDLPVVEDAAQALGAEYRSTNADRTWHAGAAGTLGCYSFFPTKNLGGFGDGGMVVTSDTGLAEVVRLLRVHGGQQMYRHKWVGWNSRLDALQAAVLRVKLPRLDGWSQGRAVNADLYDRLFDGSGLVSDGRVTLPARMPGRTHIFNQYTLRVERRDDLRQYLSERGIGNSVYYPVPLHLQECFRELGYVEGEFPEAERACREVISLPIYPELTDNQQQRVVEVITDFYEK